MNNIKIFISNFLNRSGFQVILATILSRVFSFIASWLALQLIPNKELGLVIFSYNIILLIIPLTGLGLYQSLIRYAPLLQKTEDKIQLFKYVLKKGILVTILIIFCLLFVCFFFPFENNEVKSYIIYLSLALLPEYLFQLLKVQYRILHQNKKSVKLDVLYNIFLVLLVGTLSYSFQEKGYVLALLLSPILVTTLCRKDLSWNIKNKPNIVNWEFWKYGLFAGFTSVVSQLLVSIDILVIGILLSNPAYVTDYKYISIIPISLLFLSKAFMTTDYVTITERIYDKKYIFNYVKNYISLFSTISAVILFISYFWGPNILSLFDITFSKYDSSFFILTLGVSSILILRGLFGNLLSSIGKVNINLIIVLLAVGLNVSGNYYLVPKLGVKGAIITSATIMFFASIASSLTFFYYYNIFLKK